MTVRMRPPRRSRASKTVTDFTGFRQGTGSEEPGDSAADNEYV